MKNTVTLGCNSNQFSAKERRRFDRYDDEYRNRVTFLPGGVIRHFSNRVYTAEYNQCHAYKDKDLKLVFGSIGYGKGVAIRYFLGGPGQRTLEDFLTLPLTRKDKASGLHIEFGFAAWLEDADGNVYDTISGDHVEAVNRIGHGNTRASIHGDQLYEGRSKADLAKIGVRYFPAPADVQEPLYKFVFDGEQGSLYHQFELLVDLQRMMLC